MVPSIVPIYAVKASHSQHLSSERWQNTRNVPYARADRCRQVVRTDEGCLGDTAGRSGSRAVGSPAFPLRQRLSRRSRQPIPPSLFPLHPLLPAVVRLFGVLPVVLPFGFRRPGLRRNDRGRRGLARCRARQTRRARSPGEDRDGRRPRRAEWQGRPRPGPGSPGGGRGGGGEQRQGPVAGTAGRGVRRGPGGGPPRLRRKEPGHLSGPRRKRHATRGLRCRLPRFKGPPRTRLGSGQPSHAPLAGGG